MTSIIKVDQIQTAAGGTPTLSSLGVTGSGTVLQQITGYCDGRTVSGVTFPTVTGTQDLSTSYADVTGSNITYTPPSAATTVIYRFTFKWGSDVQNGISHWRTYLDSDEVTIARSTISANYASENYGHFHQEIVVPFLIGGTDDVANAKLSSWGSAKTIKIQARDYASNYAARVHDNQWWDGDTATGTNIWLTPSITITALG
jgi:hypothetical protein